jgi:penicillin-binding protein 1A
MKRIALPFGAIALLLTGCAIGERKTPPAPARIEDSAALEKMRLARLSRIVRSNQIVFEKEAKGWRAVCRCGPKLPFAAFPRHLLGAMLAAEDRRFMQHNGVDWRSVLRAAYRNVWERRAAEGASTLTMQLAKNTLLSPEKTFARKYTEARLAFDIEAAMSKQEIAAAYLNQVVFGHGGGRPIVGVEQAARYFFGKPAAEVNLLEAAILVGMLKKPARYNPRRHRARALARARKVLDLMVAEGYVGKAAVRRALRLGIVRGNKKPLWPETRYFTDWTVAEFKRAYPNVAVDGGLRIAITLEVRSQAAVEDALSRALAPWPGVETAMVTMAKDGRVVAMSGGRDYGRKPFNHATDARRQPASAFKPFVYLAALEAGARFGPAMVSAFAQSDNGFAIAMARLAGLDRVAATARRLGIRSPLRRDMSLPLGASETTLLELTAAYVPFASGGYAAAPYGYWGALADGEIVWRKAPARRRVAKPAHMRAMHHLLRGAVLDGTGTAAAIIPGAAGKTGTNEGFKDAWFIGYTARQITGLWLGSADGRPLPGLTGSAAAALWADAVSSLPKH